VKRQIFIGDLHGCAEEFRDLLEVLRFCANTDQLYLTGDAFTKGPDPLGIWQLILECNARMVLGNHDAALLSLLKERMDGREKDLKPEHKRTLDALMPVVKNLMSWLERLPLYLSNDPFLLVHAGIHPEKGLAGTSRDEFLAIRTWPPEKGVEGPRWHQAYTPVQHRLLVFGHDAPGGLVLKQQAGVPYLVGLDTGCVYGNKLSAYILNDHRIVQVASRQQRQFADA
jgi:hypothetical protein